MSLMSFKFVTVYQNKGEVFVGKMRGHTRGQEVAMGTVRNFLAWDLPSLHAHRWLWAARLNLPTHNYTTDVKNIKWEHKEILTMRDNGQLF